MHGGAPLKGFMLHPNSRLVWISDQIGYGIVATEFIPKGTITFVQDNLDIIVEEESPLLSSPLLRNLIERYSYINAKGDRIISWDLGKYMNHCCHANTLTTGYGFEIAIRDIQAGEEITDDYGIFTEVHDMNIVCNKSHCRFKLNINDFDMLVSQWDHKIQEALPTFYHIDQPLMPYLDEVTMENINNFFSNPGNYISVRTQKPKTSFRALSLSRPQVS